MADKPMIFLNWKVDGVEFYRSMHSGEHHTPIHILKFINPDDLAEEFRRAYAWVIQNGYQMGALPLKEDYCETNLSAS